MRPTIDNTIVHERIATGIQPKRCAKRPTETALLLGADFLACARAGGNPVSRAGSGLRNAPEIKDRYRCILCGPWHRFVLMKKPPVADPAVESQPTT
jgi:hypothetical protein